MNDKKIFAENIKQARKNNKLSQQQLADKMNIKRQTISKWENGICYPDIDKLIELKKILNVTLDSLFGINIENIKILKEAKLEAQKEIYKKKKKLKIALATVIILLFILYWIYKFIWLFQITKVE